MPVHRSKKLAHANESNEEALSSQYFVNPTPAITTIPCVRDADAQEPPTASDSASSSSVPEIYFPTEAKEREAYRTKLGKAGKFHAATLSLADDTPAINTSPMGRV